MQKCDFKLERPMHTKKNIIITILFVLASGNCDSKVIVPLCHCCYSCGKDNILIIRMIIKTFTVVVRGGRKNGFIDASRFSLQRI